jgi:prepilin-type N-terminal cleavage/methylation domain-containing protein
MSPTLYNFMGNRISKGNRKEGHAPTFKGKKATWAFTLVELLAVIAIIGLLAGIVLGTSGIAVEKSRLSRIRAEKEKLVTAIEDYKSVMGTYPPDNQDTTKYDLSNTNDYHMRCGKNPLFYELSGCTFDRSGGSKGTFTTQNKGESVPVDDLKNAFGVKGIDNSARNKKDIPYRGVSFKPNQFAAIKDFQDVNILVVPIDKGPQLIPARDANRQLNPWFYDASTTNRHNLETYDLWSEYNGRDKRVNVIGNW